jgi:hypothetical protein
MGLPAVVGCAKEPESRSVEIAAIPARSSQPAATATSTSTAIATPTAIPIPTPIATPAATATATPAATATTTGPRQVPPLKDAWNVSFPLDGKDPGHRWCSTGTAQCALARDVPQRTETGAAASMGCPSVIDVACPCSPANDTGCAPHASCTAPFLAKISTQERAKKPTACCYDMPRVCVPPNVGRLLRVKNRAIVAGTEERGDWRAAERVDASALTEDDRIFLASHWRTCAQGEHASIASFSRVALQMMALGAPADLLAGVHAAALDEVEHARACFAIASSYSGFDEGPGALPVDALAVRPLELEQIASETFLDACVGETVGTVVARAAAERARDASVRATLERIASDEERHAELAWRTLAWAVRAGGARVQRALIEALLKIDETLAPIAARPAHLSAHGVLPADQEDCVRRRAIEEVVVPCLRALIESRPEAGERRPERLP